MKESDVTEKKVRKSHGNSVGKFVLGGQFLAFYSAKSREGLGLGGLASRGGPPV